MTLTLARIAETIALALLAGAFLTLWSITP